MRGAPTVTVPALAVCGALAVAHAGPVATAVTALRRRWLPALAGIGDPGHVALTFDDGPDPRSTPRFLEVLEEHGVHATFFLLGSMVSRSPGLAREIAATGHEVAVHGWGHRNLLLRTPRATYDDLARGLDTVAAATGVAPGLFRPPYGVLTGSAVLAARRLGLTPVLWTCWGRDWEARATPASVLARVVGDLDGGGTVLLHDSDCTASPEAWRSAHGALPRLLEECRVRRGLRVGPLREHGPAFGTAPAGTTPVPARAPEGALSGTRSGGG